MDSAKMAKYVYKWMLKENRIEVENSAEAVHQAVTQMREASRFFQKGLG